MKITGMEIIPTIIEGINNNSGGNSRDKNPRNSIGTKIINA